MHSLERLKERSGLGTMHSFGQHAWGWLRMGRQHPTFLPPSCCLVGGFVWCPQHSSSLWAQPLQHKPFSVARLGRGTCSLRTSSCGQAHGIRAQS